MLFCYVVIMVCGRTFTLIKINQSRSKIYTCIQKTCELRAPLVNVWFSAVLSVRLKCTTNKISQTRHNDVRSFQKRNKEILSGRSHLTVSRLFRQSELTMSHIFMTHDPREPSVNWPVTRVTRDSRLLTSHYHSVTFAYPREREASIDAISISYCHYALPHRCIIS